MSSRMTHWVRNSYWVWVRRSWTACLSNVAPSFAHIKKISRTWPPGAQTKCSSPLRPQIRRLTDAGVPVYA